MFHGGVRLARVGCHARALAKSRKSGVYDNNGASYLSCAWGSCISYSGWGICHGVRGILRVMIWCAVILISPLVAAVLWLGAASLDSFRDLTQGFVDPATLADHQGCCVRDGEAVLVGHRGCGALVQEGPSLVFLVGVFSVCVWCWSSVYAASASPIFALNLKSGVVVIGVTPRRSLQRWRCRVLVAHCRVMVTLRWQMPPLAR
jgi:hypothetical protein